MSRKHARIPTAATPAPRRRMLYGLVGLSIATVVIALSFAFRTTPGQPSIDAQAAPPTTVAAAEPAARALASFAPFHDFGTVSMANGNVTHRYVIANLTSAPLNITQLSTSCMCTTATLITPSARRGPYGMPGHGAIPTIRETLAPRERAQVEVVFDPNAHGPAGVGLIERTITVLNDAGQPLQLGFRATVRP